MPSWYLGWEIPGGGRAATPKFLRRRPVDRRSRRTANKSTKGGILKDYERRHIWVTQMALKSCTAGRWHSNCTRRGSCPAYFTSKQRPSRIKLRSVSCKTTVFSQAKWVKTISVKWDKFEDTIAVQFLSASSAPKKREVLAKLAKVYDPLGLASPITLQGKQIYRDGCDCKVSLDSYPRESENTLANVGAVTSGGSNHTKTLSTLSTTSHLRWAACVRGRVNLWGRSSSVFSCAPRRLNYSNPGCGKNKISQERTNRPQVGVSQRPQGYQFCHQCKKRTKKTTRTHDLRLAG